MSAAREIARAPERHETWMPPAALVRDVVERFGTPTFVYDAGFARAVFEELRGALDERLDIFYSLKANPNVSLTHLITGFGAGAEVSSLAELHTALEAGVAPGDIIFVGPAKSHEELRACVEQGIFAVVCELLDEIERLDAIAAERDGAPMPVMIRVNPAFTGGGSGLTMSGKPKQFGLDEEKLRASADRLAALEAVEIVGFHVYMGTRFLAAEPILENTDKILELVDTLADELGISVRAVDIGGGLGVPYFDNESALDLDALTTGPNRRVADFKARYPDSRMILELGRFLVAGCGAMLTTVRDLKDSRGETFAIADGGTNVHMAAVGVGGFAKRNFPVVNFTSRAEDSAVYTVTGPLCTPNDSVAKRATLPETAAGDVLGILFSGAYGPTASPTQFLSHGYPAEVLVLGDDVRLVRKRESVEDILAPQVLVRDEAAAARS